MSMTVPPRRAGTVSVAVPFAVLLLIALAYGLDLSYVRSDGDLGEAAAARHEELNAFHARLFQQMAASDGVAARLVDGQIGMADAIDELAEINGAREGFRDHLHSAFPSARTYQEQLARYALNKARRRLDDDPTRQAEVVARLEAECACLAAE
jgi:hypothetical protein